MIRLQSIDRRVAVVNEDRRGPRQHIVRVRAEVLSSASSLVSEFRPVRKCAWKCRVVRLCCRRRCRQTATCVRAVEWALAGVLPGLGSGMVRGPYAGPAARAGCGPARNLNEWPPGLARRGPRPGEVGKAHGADRPHLRASVPANSPPSPRRRAGVRRAGASGFLRTSGTTLRCFCAAWSLAGPPGRHRSPGGRHHPRLPRRRADHHRSPHYPQGGGRPQVRGVQQTEDRLGQTSSINRRRSVNHHLRPDTLRRCALAVG